MWRILLIGAQIWFALESVRQSSTARRPLRRVNLVRSIGYRLGGAS